MPIIDYEASKFNSHYNINGNGVLNCTWADIIRSAVTIGRKNAFDVWRHGRFSLYEVMYREYMIYANLMEDRNGNIIRTTAYRNLDPSEKTAISYFLGITVTKLFAEKLLNTPWLMHLDVYNSLNPVLTRGGRPDFVGLDNRRRWIILESKGRSNGYDNNAMTDAKQQTRKLRRIDGTLPNLRAACQSYFFWNRFSVKLEDPPEYDDNAIDIKLGTKRFLSNYYHFFNDPFLSGRTEKYNDREVFIVYTSELGTSIGIDLSVLQYIREKNFDGLIGYFAQNDLYDFDNDSTISVGSDGIVVITDYFFNIENMKKEPKDRPIKIMG